MAGEDNSVGMGLFFYPRGGSAQVAGYLSRALGEQGWSVTLACGSLGSASARTNARAFFAGIETEPGAYDEAVAAWERGADPMDAPFPMQPSYEEREGVPDRSFPRVSPDQAERMAGAWARLIARSQGLRRARIFHLHHLTPLHNAVAQAAPGVPIVTHLHGTELKMLDAIAREEPGLGQGPHAHWWAARMRAAAHSANATVVISPHQQREAVRLLGIDPATVHLLPDGVDNERFAVRRSDDEERRARWLDWLVRDPQGWDEKSGAPGSVGYTEHEVTEAFFDPSTGASRPVLMFVGRFLGFKRVPLLVRAYARARPRMAVPAPLVIWGGAPGEWEGEHPHTVATGAGVSGVFFAGWRGHDDLPQGLACADCFVAPSTDEPFGLVYLEAMACGLPVIGTLSGGPPSFINLEADNPDGWLVPPDDEEALADAIVRAVDDPIDLRRRGDNGARHVRDSYSWNGLARRFAQLYEQVADTPRR
ncbi:MAG TPA: glycosyltransferase family 4 protein [Gaiellales bacterium]|nr:glycosyltransferase family 4 protein [Gaiellales bacterium]